MNKQEFIQCVTRYLKDRGDRKQVASPRRTFHISDDEGNRKAFTVRHTDQKIPYTIEDVTAIVESCMDVLLLLLSKGEPVTFRSFGSFGLKYRKGRQVKMPNTGELVDVKGRYNPFFACGRDLRLSAKVYEMSLEDGTMADLPLSSFDIDAEEAE